MDEPEFELVFLDELKLRLLDEPEFELEFLNEPEFELEFLDEPEFELEFLNEQQFLDDSDLAIIARGKVECQINNTLDMHSHVQVTRKRAVKA